MKSYLLPKDGTFYKANMHTHTTMSDGNLTPEQVKDAYKSHGYSIVAFTDHDLLVDRSHLCDKDFLALNGLEVEANEVGDMHFQDKKTVHLCFIALSPDNLIQPCYHREKYLFGNAPLYRNQLKIDESKPNFERVYSIDGVNAMIEDGVKNGFFVTYNHPIWSEEIPEFYLNYKNMHAMEICNYGSFVNGYDEYVPQIYDMFLKRGTRLFCVGGDDNHNKYPFNDRRSDSFGAFTMIKSPSLNYKDVTDALLKGNFYASQGPEIYELYYENERVHIKCSPVDKIMMKTGTRHAVAFYDQTGNGITEAEFWVDTPIVNYVRFTVVDKEGKHANTNAYYYKEFVK